MIRSACHQVDDSIERLLIISDIHSNLQPLLIFDELRKGLEGSYQLVFNGDLFSGGCRPVETAEWVIEHVGELATLGNHDEQMLRCTDVDDEHPPYSEPGAYQRLSAEQREFFQQLPHRLELDWRGKRIILMHGHVTMEGRNGSWMATPDQQIANFDEPGADLFVASHTHYAFVQQVGDGLFANTGTMCLPILGIETDDGLHVQSGREEIRPDDDRRTSFLSVTVEGGQLKAEIVRFDYDRESVLEEMKEEGRTDLELFRKWLSEGIVSNQ